MRYSVLGTTRVFHDDGSPAALGGARLRALVAVLALRGGRTVPVGVLVDEVWDGDAPADAVGALQALVGRTRRTLGHGAVLSADGGYRLGAGPEDIDLHRFGRLASEGARALADGDPGKAVDLLDEAIGLWRGPALADLPDRRAEAARWEARLLAARRARLEARLALGGAEEALTDLAGLCDEHPLDEPLQALRMRALRAAGRTAEALAAYESVRHRIADRLGADPGPELRALHAELLRPAPAVRDTAAPASVRHASGATASASAPPSAAASAAHPSDAFDAHPSAASAVHPSARDRVFAPDQLSAPDQFSAPDRVSAPGGACAPGSASVPVAASADSRGRVGNLRARLTSFVGRETDIDAIRDDLAGARLVTLLGTGGAGKTRLSQEAAERVAGAYPDGVWFVELAPVGDPANVPEAVLTGLGARETVLRGARAEELRVASERRGDDPLLRLAEHCARRRMLIVLDNCEHVVAAAATLAERLLEGCPGLKVLATSREPLGVPGEVVRPVGPLPGPMALRLFAERAAASNPAFRAGADTEAAEEICRRLDGLPLAIELAAARLRMLTPRQIADRLDDRFRLLTSGSRTVLPRQQTLRAVVDWSWDLLDPAERTVLRRLSVFARGCDLPAAEAVCATTTGPPGGAAHAVPGGPYVAGAYSAGPQAGQPASGHPASGQPEARPEAGGRAAHAAPGGPYVAGAYPAGAYSAGSQAGHLASGHAASGQSEARAEAGGRAAHAAPGGPYVAGAYPAGAYSAGPQAGHLASGQSEARPEAGGRAAHAAAGERSAGAWVTAARAERAAGPHRVESPDPGVPASPVPPCASGFGRPASGSLAPATRVDTRDVLTVLGALVDKSLVMAEPSADGGMRYRLLETVGEYAAERLDAAGDREDAERAHLTYYRELARRTEPSLRGPEQNTAVGVLEREYENLRTALRRAVAAADEDEALCLVLSLAWYWQMRNMRADARHWAQAVSALGSDPFAPPVAPAPPLHTPVVGAAPPLEPALRLEARRGVRLIGMVSMEHGMEDWTAPEQLEWLGRVAEIYRPGLPQTCRFPGSLWFFALVLVGNAERLREVLDATVRGCEESGDAWSLAAALQLRANVLANRTEWAGDASADADRSLEIFDGLGDLWGAAEALSARGEARERRGEFELAAEDFTLAVDRAERLGARGQVPILRARLAGVLDELGRGEEAEAILRDVLAGADDGATVEVVPAARLILGLSLGRRGRVPEAREQFDLLAREFAAPALALFDGLRLGGVAWLDCLEGRFEDALDHVCQALDRALTPLSAMVAPHMPAIQLLTAAEALAGLGREPARDAARLLGAYEHVKPAGHVAVSALERDNRDRAERTVRALLGDARFEALRAEGGALTLEEATALVHDRSRELRASSGTS
ncbi:BTAD domain-containing putative transcriptional regulator [Streptomyces sp. NPDC058434]|uniref:BTAD domain-containing putative transcriptional regulator n=1 Tax=Streptomyces sp. NPDC058434 TaxID=3346498 RepID=UPI00364DE503